MIDFDRLKVRFGQFGGWRLAWEYVKLGLLGTILKQLGGCVLKKRSVKSIYPAILDKVNPLLVKEFRTAVLHDKEEWQGTETNANDRGKTYIWWCWLQGYQNAPDLAKACYKSLHRYLTDVEIVCIDEKNFSDWIELPEHVVCKYKKGKIPPAMFSDMLRLQLLHTHGGVWIDSTVLLTTPPHAFKDAGKLIPAWEDIIKADFFVFQYRQPKQRWTGNTSNWFIAAKKGNPFTATVRDMLFAYWQKHDVVLNYYICHLALAETARLFPKQIAAMPYGWSLPCIELGNHLGDVFSQKHWDIFKTQYPWHKLSYRLKDGVVDNSENYYNKILS